MPSTVIVWVLRASWLAVGVLGSDALTDAVDGTSRGFEVTVIIGGVALWGLTLVATLVPLPLTLTIVRVVTPASVVAFVWTLAADGSSATGVAGLAAAVVASVTTATPQVGERFVDGASYGDERRMPLRAPLPVLFGPVPVAWAAIVGGVCAGPLLLADGHWVAGTALTVLGVPTAAVAARALHFLATRVVVFVPNGVVLADPATLTDPVLFRRSTIATLGPALADTTAHDLTAAAAGLALEVRLEPPAEISVRGRGRDRTGTVVTVDAVLFTPTSPGAVLTEAARRGIRVG